MLAGSSQCNLTADKSPTPSWKQEIAVIGSPIWLPSLVADLGASHGIRRGDYA